MDPEISSSQERERIAADLVRLWAGGLNPPSCVPHSEGVRLAKLIADLLTSLAARLEQAQQGLREIIDRDAKRQFASPHAERSVAIARAALASTPTRHEDQERQDVTTRGDGE